MDPRRRVDLFLSLHPASRLHETYKAHELADALEKALQLCSHDIGTGPSIFCPSTSPTDPTAVPEFILRTRGGGIALFLLTPLFFTATNCLAELRAFRHVYTHVRILFVSLGLPVSRLLSFPTVQPFVPTWLESSSITYVAIGTKPETVASLANLVWDAWAGSSRFFPDGRPSVLGETADDSIYALSNFFTVNDLPALRSALELSSTNILDLFREAIERGDKINYRNVRRLYTAIQRGCLSDEKRKAIEGYERKWVNSDTWEWGNPLRESLISCWALSRTDLARSEIDISEGVTSNLEDGEIQRALHESETLTNDIGFSSPITAGIAPADKATALAAALNLDRSVKFKIDNRTDNRLALIDSYMECGMMETTPNTIEPHKSAIGYVTAKFGTYGVKGALIYQWGDNEKDRVCMFLENPVRGSSKSGIKYYWDTWKNSHWYYCDVPTKTENRAMGGTINEWFTIKSSISGGNHAGGAFVLETHPISSGATFAESAVTLAAALNIDLSIKFEISNRTDKKLTLIDSHMDCGMMETTPNIIEPHKSAIGYVTAKFSTCGVKGALIYQWGGNDKERVCMFLENRASGANKSGIKYYWDTWKNSYWYYRDVPTTTENWEMGGTINEWFTIKSFISGGNHAGGAFILKT